MAATSARHVTREIKAHGRAAANLAVNFYVAFGLTGKTIDHAKAKAGALPHFLGRKERLKRAFTHLLCHADTRIGDRERNIIARHHVWIE